MTNWQSDLLAREPQSAVPRLDSQLNEATEGVAYFRGAACHWCREASRWRRLARWTFGLLAVTLGLLAYVVGK